MTVLLILSEFFNVFQQLHYKLFFRIGSVLNTVNGKCNFFRKTYKNTKEIAAIVLFLRVPNTSVAIEAR